MNMQWNGGRPDPSFGDNGQVRFHTLGLSPGHTFVLRDQKLLAVSTARDGTAVLVRYLSDGVRDPSFGIDGVVRSPLGISGEFTKTFQTLLSDGKLLLAGHDSEGVNLYYVRLTPDGRLDGSFGVGGRVAINLPNTPVDRAAQIAVQADGKLVALARAGWRFVLFRLHADGSLDTTFGSGGFSYEFPPRSSLWGLQALPNGKLLIIGMNDSEGMISRYDQNGQPDASFGDGGHFYFQIPENPGYIQIMHAAVQADGKIVVVGSAGSYPAVGLIARVKADGSGFDSTFNGGVPLLTGWAPAGTTEHSVVILEDGKLLSLGGTFGARPVATLRRFLDDGTPDAAFGLDGIVVTEPEPGVMHMPFGLQIQSDGKYVVSVGMLGTGTGWALGTFRFLPS